MKLLERLRSFSVVEPLPPMRSTSDILSDIDRQVGRLMSVRERAEELIKKMDAVHHEKDGRPDAPA